MEPTFQVLPPQQRPPAQPKKQGVMAGIGVALVALFKFKYLLLGGLKTGLSMFVMIWVYSMLFGWPFAAGFVFLIFVHEMGHVIAAKWLGLPVTAPLFIPFFGAAILLKENPRDAWTEALMAYGGPLAGCIGSWICWFIALHFGLGWVMAVASMSFLINMFNMIPVPPLDGGRICAAISPWFWFIGILLLGAALFFFHSGTALVIGIFVLIFLIPRLKQTFFQPPTPAMQAYYATHISKRLTMALLYLGLLAVLMLGYWDASSYLRPYANS